MPNPKRRHSKRRTSTRRAHDFLVSPLLRMPALPRNEAAPPGLPPLRLLQGRSGTRYVGLTESITAE